MATTVVITVSGNWSWPSGVTTCVIEMLGGGGAGGPATGNPASAGGGTGGGYTKSSTITKGVESVLVIVVGAGGVAGLTASNGTPSTVTQNGTLILQAIAGNGAVIATGTTGAGSTTSNGSATGAATATSGGNGGNGTSTTPSGGGGGAGGPSSSGGNASGGTAGVRGTGTWLDGSTTRHSPGAAGVTAGNVGGTGGNYGGGGSGGNANSATDQNSGAGGPGIVAITYTPVLAALTLPTAEGAYTLTGSATAPRDIGSCARLLLELGDFLLYEDASHVLLEHSGPCGGAALTLPTDVGTYAIAGSAATFLRGWATASTVGTYALAGSDATFRRGLVGATTAGAYLLIGTPADLAKIGAASMTAVPGAYLVTGVDAGLRRGRVLLTETGAYLLTGADVAFVKGALVAEPGSYLIDGAAATLVYSAALPPYVIREVLTRRMRRSPAIADEDKWIFHHALQIDLETGVGLVTGEGSVPKVMLRWSDDGGQTWSDEHWVSAGKMGEYQTRAIWQRLGRSRDRVYETTVTDAVQWNLLSAILHLEPGLH